MLLQVLSTSTILLVLFHQAEGHGFMIEPPARNSLWRIVGESISPKNPDDNGLNCGSRKNQHYEQGGRCGMCGDPYQGPREHEAGGKYANGIISRTYLQGSKMEVRIVITANHQGSMVFRLCPNNDPKKAVTEECLDKYVLTNSLGEEKTKLGDRVSVGSATLQLPPDVTCSQCVLQWYWKTTTFGKGEEEIFINCADISIVDDTKVTPPPKPTEAPSPYNRKGLLPGEWECRVKKQFKASNYAWCIEACLTIIPIQRNCPRDRCECWQVKTGEGHIPYAPPMIAPHGQVVKMDTHVIQEKDDGKLKVIRGWFCTPKGIYKATVTSKWCYDACIAAQSPDRNCPEVCDCVESDENYAKSKLKETRPTERPSYTRRHKERKTTRPIIDFDPEKGGIVDDKWCTGAENNKENIIWCRLNCFKRLDDELRNCDSTRCFCIPLEDVHLYTTPSSNRKDITTRAAYTRDTRRDRTTTTTTATATVPTVTSHTIRTTTVGRSAQNNLDQFKGGTARINSSMLPSMRDERGNTKPERNEESEKRGSDRKTANKLTNAPRRSLPDRFKGGKAPLNPSMLLGMKRRRGNTNKRSKKGGPIMRGPSAETAVKNTPKPKIAITKTTTTTTTATAATTRKERKISTRRRRNRSRNRTKNMNRQRNLASTRPSISRQRTINEESPKEKLMTCQWIRHNAGTKEHDEYCMNNCLWRNPPNCDPLICACS